jgi:curli biogenesis system outer membrane secretion channel CsgG
MTLLRLILAAICLVIVPSHAIAQDKKPVVAIYKMDDLTNSGQSDTFSTMIETAIASTSKFRVVERERLNKLLNEQGKAKGGLITTNRPGKVGGFEGADYLIYGTITAISSTKKKDLGSELLSGVFSGNRGGQSCNKAVVTMEADIKISDASSGEVRYVRRISEQQTTASVCGGEDASIDVGALMRAAADKIASGLVTTIYPIQVAAVQADGVIVLNYGEGTVRPEDYMTVFLKGEPIRDPATGEVIANNETKLGVIRVTDVTGRISKAQPASSFTSAIPIGAIVREATPDELKSVGKSPDKKRKR